MSSESQLVINGKRETFTVNQMFCLGAIVPVLEGAAIASRVISVELSSRTPVEIKRKESTEILSDGFFNDKIKFFNRTFYSLHLLFESKNKIHDAMVKLAGSVRKADNVSPCMAAWWHCKNSRIIDDAGIEEILSDYRKYDASMERDEDDHDTFFRILFSHIIKIDGQDFTVSELMLKGRDSDIKRLGVKIDGSIRYDENKNHLTANGELFIASKSEPLKKMMERAETYFYGNYQVVLKHHPAWLTAKTKRIIQSQYTHIFDLKKLAERYFLEPDMKFNNDPF
jgi:hypothetical protein